MHAVIFRISIYFILILLIISGLAVFWLPTNVEGYTFTSLFIYTCCILKFIISLRGTYDQIINFTHAWISVGSIVRNYFPPIVSKSGLLKGLRSDTHSLISIIRKERRENKMGEEGMSREGTCFCSIWLRKMGFRNHWNLDQVWSGHLNPSDSPQETSPWAMISRRQLRAQGDKKNNNQLASFSH